MTNKISEKDKKDWENFLSKKEKLPNKDIKTDISNNFTTGYYKNLWINHLSTKVGKDQYDSFWREKCISEIKQGSRYYNTLSEKDSEVRDLNNRYFGFENRFLNTDLTTSDSRQKLLNEIKLAIIDVNKKRKKYEDGHINALASDQQAKQSSLLYNNSLKEVLNLVMCIIILCYYIAKLTNVFKTKSIAAMKDTANDIVKDITNVTQGNVTQGNVPQAKTTK